MNQNKAFFQIKKFENTRNTSTLMFDVKGARAFWDDSLSVPGTDRRGGFRCPLGTENGGQITDRFGRNCGTGIVRRVGKLFGELGERLETAGGTRREERRTRTSPSAGGTGRTRGILAGSPSGLSEVDDPFAVSSITTGAKKPIEKPIETTVQERKITTETLGKIGLIYGDDDAIRKELLTYDDRRGTRYNGNNLYEPQRLQAYDEALEAVTAAMLELPGDRPDIVKYRVRSILETLKKQEEYRRTLPKPENDRLDTEMNIIKLKQRLVADIYNRETFRQQAALFLSEDYVPDGLDYSSIETYRRVYESEINMQGNLPNQLRVLQQAREKAIKDLDPDPNDFLPDPLLGEKQALHVFERLDLISQLENDLKTKNDQRLGWGIMLDGESETELAPGIKKIKYLPHDLEQINRAMRASMLETTENLELQRQEEIKRLTELGKAIPETFNGFRDYDQKQSYLNLIAIGNLLKERAALKDKLDANPNGYHPDGTPVMSKTDLENSPNFKESLNDEWNYFSQRIASFEDLENRDQNLIDADKKELDQRLAYYAFSMNRVAEGSQEWKNLQVSYHAAQMAFDTIQQQPKISIPEVLPDEVDAKLKEIALQEFDKRQEFLGEWMRGAYPAGETPWQGITTDDLEKAVENDDSTLIADWITGAYEIEMTGLDGNLYRTRASQIDYGEMLEDNVSGDESEIMVYVDIEVQENGVWKKIGESVRHISPGDRTIYSASMQIYDLKYRGAGIQAIYNGNSWTWAKGAGIKSVTVTAVSDGSYVWGRVGYEDDVEVDPMPFAGELMKYRRGIPGLIKTEDQAVAVKRLIDISENSNVSHIDWIFALENGAADTEITREEQAARKLEIGNWFKVNVPFESGALSLSDDERFSLDPRIRVRRAKGKAKPKIPLLRG